VQDHQHEHAKEGDGERERGVAPGGDTTGH
jgi:hypothetical protein